MHFCSFQKFGVGLKMIMNLYISISVCTVLFLGCTDTASIGQNRVLPVAGISGLLDSALSVYDLVDSLLNPDNTQEKLEEMTQTIISVINEKIEASNQKLFASIKETLTLARIDEINFNIRSVLDDLRFYMEASDNEKDSKKREFIRQASGIVTEIRSLPSRLKRTLANSAMSLLEMMANRLECNMTGMAEFEIFYRNLTENGVIIELTYKRFEYPNSSLSAEEDHWRNEENDMKNNFEQQNKSCKAEFDDFIKRDIVHANDIQKLSEALQQKYPWYGCDIFFLESSNDEQVLYIEGETNGFMATEINGYRRYVLVMERGKNEDGVDIKCLVLHSSKETNLSTLFVLDKESLGHDFTSTNVGTFSRHTTFFYSTEGRHCDAHDEVPLEEWNLHDGEEMKDESEGLVMWKIIAISVGGTLGFALIVAAICCWKFRS